jgi:hypothetical protein
VHERLQGVLDVPPNADGSWTAQAFGSTVTFPTQQEAVAWLNAEADRREGLWGALPSTSSWVLLSKGAAAAGMLLMGAAVLVLPGAWDSAMPAWGMLSFLGGAVLFLAGAVLWITLVGGARGKP